MIEYMKRVSCWWMSFVCLLCFAFTTQIDSRECCVWFQCFTQWCYTSVSYVVPCWYKEKVICWWTPFVCHLLYLHVRSSSVIAVFVFNASLNDAAPVYSIVFPVEKRERQSVLLIAAFCVPCVFTTHIDFHERCIWFQRLTQWRYPSVFNLVACRWCQHVKGNSLMDVFYVSVFFCLDHSNWV